MTYVKYCILDDMGVSKNNGIPKSPILIGFSTINHPFSGTPILETSILVYMIIVHVYISLYYPVVFKVGLVHMAAEAIWEVGNMPSF